MEYDYALQDEMWNQTRRKTIPEEFIPLTYKADIFSDNKFISPSISFSAPNNYALNSFKVIDDSLANITVLITEYSLGKPAKPAIIMSLSDSNSPTAVN